MDEEHRAAACERPACLAKALKKEGDELGRRQWRWEGEEGGLGGEYGNSIYIKLLKLKKYKSEGGGHEVPQWYLAVKPNDLNSVLGIHMIDGENQILQITL